MLETIESLRGEAANPTVRAEYFASRQDIYDLAIDVSMELAEREPHRGHSERAWQIAERRRARSLLDFLHAARFEPEADADPELLAERDILRHRLLELEQGRLELLSTNQLANEEAAEQALRERQATQDRDIRQALRELEAMEDRVHRQSPFRQSLAPARPLSLETIRNQVIDEHTAVLSYSLGGTRSFLWVLTRDELRTYILAPRHEIEGLVARVSPLLFETPHLAPRQRAHLLRQLGVILLTPAADMLHGKRLLILPDGILHYLPFAALEPPRGPSQEPRPLIVDHEIAYLPSASTAAMLRQQRCTRPRAPALLTIFDDPIYRRDDPRLPILPSAPTVANFERLPFASREAELILAQADGKKIRRNSGAAANRDQVLTGNLERYRILHFATHALLDVDQPERSSIALSFYDAAGRNRNGLLPVQEIYGLRLAADLVVLSACRTALGKNLRGEGLVGLTRGFLHAGAAQVVASLWQVDDEATAELMNLFYQGLLVEGLPPPAALRHAQLSLRHREERWSAPYFWAGFGVFGDCGTSLARE